VHLDNSFTRLLDPAAKSRDKELRAAVIVALNTGLRLGELLGLTWERVDLRRALVGLGPKGHGRVFKTRYLKTAYNNAVEAAKLDDVTFHTLRHTFASWAVTRGSRSRSCRSYWATLPWP
jgi:integrase